MWRAAAFSSARAIVVENSSDGSQRYDGKGGGHGCFWASTQDGSTSTPPPPGVSLAFSRIARRSTRRRRRHRARAGMGTEAIPCSYIVSPQRASTAFDVRAGAADVVGVVERCSSVASPLVRSARNERFLVLQSSCDWAPRAAATHKSLTTLEPHFFPLLPVGLYALCMRRTTQPRLVHVDETTPTHAEPPKDCATQVQLPAAV